MRAFVVSSGAGAGVYDPETKRKITPRNHAMSRQQSGTELPMPSADAKINHHELIKRRHRAHKRELAQRRRLGIPTLEDSLSQETPEGCTELPMPEV